MEKMMPVFTNELTDLKSEVERILATIVSNDDLSGQSLNQLFQHKTMMLENTDLA